ncbi:MAG: radical SAM protein [Myxococcales bacterium]|nr:radical SAM protein [Myxococcales bacterium]MCB9520962.1 radical SAM protein [Myxococcales bacterium]MCB9532625.1 radical SAM protein [Myxococcales bacterium]
MAVSWIAFHVTDRCQLNCDHCLRDPARRPVDIDVDLVARVLDQAVRDYAAHEVALTGGEPTLHPRFLDIVDVIVERDLAWHFVTNGLRLERVLPSILAVPARRAGLTAVDLSLDGATEATHDGIRGAGSFRGVLAAAALCQANGVPFVLQMAVNRRNIDEIEQLALMAAQLGAGRVSFEMTQPTGTLLDASLRVDASAARRARERVEQMNAALAIPVSFSDGFPAPSPFVMCEAFTSEVLHVDVEGNLNLCCRHAGIPSDGPPADRIADLRTTSLVDAHRLMMAMTAGAIAQRLDAIAAGEVRGWDTSPCNFCLKCFGKPHWTDDGVGGPRAVRERWRGAWAPREGAD